MVYCVDDDAVASMIVEISAKNVGICTEIRIFQQSETALELLKAQVSLIEENRQFPDLIFLDLNMPLLDGFEFLEKYASDCYPYFPQTGIVIVSSSLDPEDRKLALSYPFVWEFISKPINRKQLEEMKAIPTLKRFFERLENR